jgi:arsenate reductase (thioredoxin)
MALELLNRLNYDTSNARSKSWEEFSAPGAPELDFVFTVCNNAANEVCPIWPGQPMSAHWGLPDPVAAEGDETQRALAFADTYRMLNNRISIFTSLPLTSLDKISLQRRLDDIGKGRPTSRARRLKKWRSILSANASAPSSRPARRGGPASCRTRGSRT